MRALAVPAIRLYQKHISPYKGFACPYRVHLGRASCSNLGLRAIRRYGLVAGIRVLRRRLALCHVAHTRHGPASRAKQSGSAPCDLPCDLSCAPDCDVPDCGKALRHVSCCDGCSCDWPDKRRRRRRDEQKYVYLPPQSGKP
jgi:uncharacterized protein